MASEKHATVSYESATTKNYVLVLHGGAGTMTKAGSSPDQIKLYTAALRAALEAGYRVLRDGGEAMDAAVAAVTVLEGLVAC